MLGVEREQLRLVVHDGGLCAFFPRRLPSYFDTTRGRRERKSLPNVKLCVFARRQTLTGTVLISCPDICLKVAFDLNFNLQNCGSGREGPARSFSPA